MSEEIIIGRRFTLVIPKDARRQLNLKEGQRVQVRVEGGRIVIEPFPLDPYAVLASVVQESYDEKHDEPKAEEWLRKHAGH